MRLDGNLDEQITVRAAVRAGFALPALAQDDIVIHTSGDIEFQRPAHPNAPRAAAGRALVLDDLACAAASRAGTHGRHPAAALADLPRAFAHGAGLRLRAGLCAAAAAGCAVFIAVKFDGFMAALRRFLEGQAQFIAHVVALPRGIPARLCTAAHAAVEQLVEDIAHTAHAAEIHAAERIAARAAAHIRAIKAKLVVTGALIRVGQHLIGFVQFLEAGFRFLVVGVQVGVAFLRLLAVGAFNVLIRRVFIDTQHFVIIALVRHVCSPLIDNPAFCIAHAEKFASMKWISFGSRGIAPAGATRGQWKRTKSAVAPLTPSAPPLLGLSRLEWCIA